MLATLFLTAMLGQQATPAPEVPADTAELLRLEEVWNDAHLHNRAEVLDRLWATDLQVMVPRMSPMTKAESLAFLKTGRFTFERYATSEISVRLFGDTAIVSGRLLRRRKVGDREVEDDWRFTKVYVRLEGRWRVVSFHASEAPPAKN